MKLGPHVILLTDEVRQWIPTASIVKALDDPTPLLHAGNAQVLVFRVYFPNQDIKQLSPQAAADAILSRLGKFRDPRLYVELLNEVYQYMDWGFADYVEWTRQATEILHRAGVKVAGFSFSTGTPSLPADPAGAREWAYLRDRDYAGVDAIALHEYWGNQGFTSWHALRYRKVHDFLGPNHPPFVITECGRDAVEGGAGGWKKDGLAPAQYAQELLAYAAELEKDPYVLGATVFTTRSNDPTWDPFAIEEAIPFILQAIPTSQPTPTAEPQTPYELWRAASEANGTPITVDLFIKWLREVKGDPDPNPVTYEWPLPPSREPPFRRGLWVWYWEDKIADLARRLKADALLVKAFDGLYDGHPWDTQIEQAAACGIRVIPWGYCYGAIAETDIAAKLAERFGAVVFDLETEWEGRSDAEKEAYAKKMLLIRLRGKWVGAAVFARPDLHRATRYDLLGQAVDAFIPMIAFQYWGGGAEKWFDDWDGAGLGRTVPWLPAYNVDPRVAAEAVKLAETRYGAASIWAAHTITDDFIRALEPGMEEIPDAIRQEIKTQLDAAWGEAEALKTIEHPDRAARLQAALAVVATRLRELGIIT